MLWNVIGPYQVDFEHGKVTSVTYHRGPADDGRRLATPEEHVLITPKFKFLDMWDPWEGKVALGKVVYIMADLWKDNVGPNKDIPLKGNCSFFDEQFAKELIAFNEAAARKDVIKLPRTNEELLKKKPDVRKANMVKACKVLTAKNRTTRASGWLCSWMTRRLRPLS